MRASVFMIACLICFWPAASVLALEPMDEAAMDSVQAQSGIAIGIDNVQVYNYSGWGYEATSGDGNKRIEFGNTASYLILNSRNPLTFRVMQNPDGVAMMELTGQPSVWLEMNTNDFSFVDQDMGSLHLSLRPPEVGRMGFMEEFLLYVAPLGTQDDFTGDGLAFQLEARSGIEEFRWDYSDTEEDFWFSSAYMAGTFADNTELLAPANWDPQGHFRIGNLNAYESRDMGPATFQIVPDEDDTLNEGYARIRLNMPMEGSARVHEIGMNTIDDQGPQPPPGWPDQPAPNPIEFAADDFGPMIIDGMEIHHLQVDFKTYEP